MEGQISLHSDIIYKGDNAYKILNIIPIHHFQNKNNSINERVLGLYVKELNGDHVLQNGSKFLICETIEEARVI